ncbi:ligase-associated DNA damage response endonuclease PdeM [Paracoccus sp. MBLB3053]|uniref:Ligase-associated DNA damage response endonuclease PdeM n=1 Tax=Paracoccus aurantius TaxID=3073814 RepID=A0ABU2HRA9_9RHOB|nr:ligase-associated DNA damage response endonuclease PdeM [Paracoccus sp. MBLB3053]MDS9467075.1 ligase-associated DNA damage response endonuclease PdeM [Paracoccus sp. MBLB3053]
MSSYQFAFHGLHLEARASGALWWAEGRCLIVADLHLGKSERLARRGGPLLPPYEGMVTLDRLTAEVETLEPARIVSLGDAFDDDLVAHSLDEQMTRGLGQLAEGRDWFWVAGNHDPASACSLFGAAGPESRLGQVALRHVACPGAGPDISGHFHPVIRLAGERRKSFLLGKQHLILPAFGAYTGGLCANDPALRNLVPEGIAICCGRRALPLPIGAVALPGRHRRR